MNRLRSFPPALLWAPLFGLAALVLAAATGGLSHSFLDPDESARYVNTLFIDGLPTLLIVWALDRVGARRWGIATAFAYLLLPLVANEARYFRIDQPVALIEGLAAVAWFRATERPSL